MAIYTVEGAGQDQQIEAASAEAAAHEMAIWQYGDGADVEWYGTGPDVALTEYVVRIGGELTHGRRIVVRAGCPVHREADFASEYAGPAAAEDAALRVREYAKAHGVPERETTVRIARDSAEDAEARPRLSWWYGFAVINGRVEVAQPLKREEPAARDYIEGQCGLFTRGPFDSEREARDDLAAREREAVESEAHGYDA